MTAAPPCASAWVPCAVPASERGVRKPDMTDDGVHFTDRVCSIWYDLVRQRSGAMAQPR